MHNIRQTIYWTLLVVPLFANADSIQNPLGSVGTFAELVTSLANAVTEIAIPFVVVFLMYAGFLFVSARGNEKNLTHAKEVFYWTIIGAAVVIGAGALAKASVHFVQSLGGDTSGNQPSGYAGQTSGGPADEQPGSFPGQTSGSPNNSGTTNTTTLTDAEINAMIQEQLLQIDSRIATASNPTSAELLREQRAIISRLGRDIIIKCGNISNWRLSTDNGVETINCQ